MEATFTAMHIYKLRYYIVIKLSMLSIKYFAIWLVSMYENMTNQLNHGSAQARAKMHERDAHVHSLSLRRYLRTWYIYQEEASVRLIPEKQQQNPKASKEDKET